MPKPIRECLNDPEIAELVRKIEAGEVHAESPCPGADTPWAREEIERFHKVLDKYVIGYTNV